MTCVISSWFGLYPDTLQGSVPAKYSNFINVFCDALNSVRITYLTDVVCAMEELLLGADRFVCSMI